MSNKVFSELYSSYYNVVAAVLRLATTKGEVTPSEISDITSRLAFRDSGMEIPHALKSGTWDLLESGESKLSHVPTMPLTTLQLRWLKSVLIDPRIGLFIKDDALNEYLKDVEPLWDINDVKIYDSFGDGDYYEDALYRSNFRTALEAIHSKRAVSVQFVSNKNKEHHLYMMPTSLEYSEKNDRFRLLGFTNQGDIVINVASIVDINLLPSEFVITKGNIHNGQVKTLVLSIDMNDENNSLERVMMHFAHYEKEAYIEDGVCRLSIKYDFSDETELVIGVLSFGPRVKVEAPSEFVNQIKERISRQIGLL